jgi:hypothetical protein
MDIKPFHPKYIPGVDSASNRNEYQESSWGHKAADVYGWQHHLHLWADCLENVEPRRLTTLWASTVCYRDILGRKADNLTDICEPIV